MVFFAGAFFSVSAASSAFFAVFLAVVFFAGAFGSTSAASAAFFAGAFFAGAFFAGVFFAADFFSSAGALAASTAAAAFLARVVFFAGGFTSVVSTVVAESFAEARDALTRVPFIDGHAQQSRLQIGIPSPV